MIWEVRRLFRELGRAADTALAPLGVTAAERALLEFLAKEKGPTTLSEIARKRAVSRQHNHQTLSRLNRRWVDRSDDPRDARSLALSLSKDGRALWNRIRAVDGQLLQRIMAQLDEKEIRAMIR
ncbi:MAG TPA: MarR family transcriptional regulator [Acidobacteriaceae bacterium]